MFDKGKKLGVKINPQAEGVLVFCSQCQEQIQVGLRVIQYLPDLKIFDEVGVYHPQCVDNPMELIEKAKGHIIPAIFMRSAM